MPLPSHVQALLEAGQRQREQLRALLAHRSCCGVRTACACLNAKLGTQQRSLPGHGLCERWIGGDGKELERHGVCVREGRSA